MVGVGFLQVSRLRWVNGSTHGQRKDRILSFMVVALRSAPFSYSRKSQGTIQSQGYMKQRQRHGVRFLNPNATSGSKQTSKPPTDPPTDLFNCIQLNSIKPCQAGQSLSPSMSPFNSSHFDSINCPQAQPQGQAATRSRTHDQKHTRAHSRRLSRPPRTKQ